MNFSIQIVDHESKPWTRCFDDFAEALAAALRDLGHSVSDGGRPILFGLFDDPPSAPVPAEAIIYNAEQIQRRGGVGHLPLGNVIWDYSLHNVEELRARGARNVVYCPVGFHSTMRRIAQLPPWEEDIDVLFTGLLNQRRREILTDLRDRGLHVESYESIYGAERDALIARAKVVLNIHYYDPAIFEIFRVSHLLANGKCVVSEWVGTELDGDLEHLARQATVHVRQDSIGAACRMLVDEPTRRRAIAADGQTIFAREDLCAFVERALEVS